MTARANPYLYLDPFTLDEADLFFGRQRETADLAKAVMDNRHTVLFGPAGVGKSSLVQAGLTPRLDDLQVGVYVLHPCARDNTFSLAHTPEGSLFSESAALEEVLGRYVHPAQPAVLAFDQLERLLDGPRDDLLAFSRSLAGLMDVHSEYRVLWICRDQELYRLDRLSSALPDILTVRCPLDHLTPEQAREAIVEPARQVRVSVADALVDTLLSALGPIEIAAPRLQVVCCALWRQRPAEATILDIDMYRALGGAKAILSGYLDDVISELADEEDQDVARALLKEMVELDDPSSAWVPRVPRSSELARLTGDNPARLDRLLAFWQDQGIVRSAPAAGTYGLSSSFLIGRVSEWAQEDMWATKDVRDMLRQALIDHWRAGKLIDKSGLGRLWQNRARMHFSAEELALILHSSLARGYQWRAWAGFASGSDVSIWPIVRQALESREPVSRSSAVVALGALRGPQVVEMLQTALTDTYPNVRGLAREALARAGTPQASEALHAHPPVDMVLVPAGTFLMGSDQGGDESPARSVYLDAFYIDRYPVTNAEYHKFVQDTGHPPPEPWARHGGTFPPGRDNHPVAYVCWFDARDYATWARKRLPTEAEWEKAARGSDGRIYPWGDRFNSAYCNTDESEYWDTTPVDAFSPGGDSPYGIADMAGNVWEWVADWYERDYYAQAPDRNPAGPEIGKTKVLRGGAWDFGGREARCSARNHEYPGPRHGLIGFRCAADAPLESQ